MEGQKKGKMKLTDLVLVIHDEAAKHAGPDAVLWECPSIAPPGYWDTCSGQSIFPIYSVTGLPETDYCGFYVAERKGSPSGFTLAIWMPLFEDEQQVRERVAKAFVDFREQLANWYGINTGLERHP